MISENIYNQLKPYETHLKTAYNSGYIRCLAANEVKKLESIYSQLGYKLSNRNCGDCVLTMCKILGGLYFAYKPLKLEQNEETKRKKTSPSKGSKGN